jgi:GNAT superfamily N-acetyltransferase
MGGRPFETRGETVIRYVDTLDGLTKEALRGFFVGWSHPRTPEEHLGILEGSDCVVLAVEDDRVVGFVTALSDGVQSAFIPLLEVLPKYRGRGIGTGLMHRMLEKLAPIPAIDLTCDPELRPFYGRLGMVPSVGMIVRQGLGTARETARGPVDPSRCPTGGER